MKRLLAALAFSAFSFGFASCSIFLPATKAVTDGVEVVTGDAWLAHSTEPYGTDMFDEATQERVWEEFRARYYSWHRDYNHIRDSYQKWFFNYDKDDPYIHQ